MERNLTDEYLRECEPNRQDHGRRKNVTAERGAPDCSRHH